MVLIDNGKGDGGYSVGVNSENKLETMAVSQSITHHNNQAHGMVFSLLIDNTPTGAGDCFLYLKNSDDKDMSISSLNLCAATDEIIEVKLCDTGTPVDGTAVIPINRNAGSGEAADGTFQTGVNITGLSGGNIVDYIAIDSEIGSHKHRWDSFIIIPKGKTLALYATNGAIALKGSLTVCFCD